MSKYTHETREDGTTVFFKEGDQIGTIIDQKITMSEGYERDKGPVSLYCTKNDIEFERSTKTPVRPRKAAKTTKKDDDEVEQLKSQVALLTKAMANQPAAQPEKKPDIVTDLSDAQLARQQVERHNQSKAYKDGNGIWRIKGLNRNGVDAVAIGEYPDCPPTGIEGDLARAVIKWFRKKFGEKEFKRNYIGRSYKKIKLGYIPKQRETIRKNKEGLKQPILEWYWAAPDDGEEGVWDLDHPGLGSSVVIAD